MENRARTSRGVWFRQPGDEGRERRRILAKALSAHEIDALGTWHWEIWGRDEQLAPMGNWRVWMICAGRGFGKTRAGAEWVRGVARADPLARIALVAASLQEARAVMVEGESGVLAASPGALAPEFEPSLRRLTWPNGAQAYLYSAAEPETLRGPQHSHACRPGAERILRECRFLAERCPVASPHRGGGHKSTGRSRRGLLLANCGGCHRRIRRNGGQAGVSPGGRMAVCRA